MVYLGYSLFIRYALATDSCVGHQNPVVISAPSGYVTVFVVGVNHSVETILMISSHNIRHILLIGGTSHILIYDGFTFPHSMLIFGNSRETSKLDRKSTRLNSSHANISYAVFCLKKN